MLHAQTFMKLLKVNFMPVKRQRARNSIRQK